ncbi:unannotated protein [freshwater metagenome]|uniref:Unannotated protein n=1 Tax=freshwater metagenome TaxID=449393 RepID=A0A6J6SVM5_9ZZZZ
MVVEGRSRGLGVEPGIEVKDEHLQPRALTDRGQLPRYEEMRHDRRVPRAGPEDDRIGQPDGGERIRAGLWLVRVEPDAQDVTGRRGHGNLSVDDTDELRGALVVSAHICDDRNGSDAARKHSAVRFEERGYPVETDDRIMRLLPQCRDEQIAKGVTGELPIAPESVLNHLSPGTAPGVVTAEGGECHAQIAGRESAELGAKPTARASVVGHAHDCGDLVGHSSQRLERGRKSVPAAERDHLRPGSRPIEAEACPADHSRPRSRCMTRVSMPSRRSRSPSSSAIATLLCLPPVHPMAIVTYRLPSSR